MRVVYLTHSLWSCWNHGNAHFQRGLLRELARMGHAILALEPTRGWSRDNLVRDHGAAALAEAARRFPELRSRTYASLEEATEALEGADVVLVHEWTAPDLVAAIGRIRRSGGRFALFFHDTHHRAVSDPTAIRALDLDGYDGVLAFGEVLAERYRAFGWGDRAFVWHEAADTQLFRPREAEEACEGDVVWIGNWGDGERSRELRTFLLDPCRHVRAKTNVYGVRYPRAARALLGRSGAEYRGWLPNHLVPDTFARHRASVHVPRRYYVTHLPGIPTIRMFEALACGIPLVSAPWDDAEGLFRSGRDYLSARDGRQMTAHLRAVLNDGALRRSLVSSGLETVARRHTCAHRARELLAIVDRVRVPQPAGVA